MKRTTLLGVLLVAVLAVTAALSTPKPAHAIMCCDNGGYQTERYWYMAATCSDAAVLYRAAARPEANDFCGGSTLVCAFSLPPCYAATDANGQPTGMWIIDGVATFGCKDICDIYYQ